LGTVTLRDHKGMLKTRPGTGFEPLSSR
jgi:hypothetical protein